MRWYVPSFITPANHNLLYMGMDMELEDEVGELRQQGRRDCGQTAAVVNVIWLVQAFNTSMQS